MYVKKIHLQDRVTKQQSPVLPKYSVTKQQNGNHHSNENNGVVKERSHSSNSHNNGNSVRLVNLFLSIKIFF